MKKQNKKVGIFVYFFIFVT